MRITDIYFAGYAPFMGSVPLHLQVDDERVLFLGISGSGKTTVFRAVGWLWRQLMGYLEGQLSQPIGEGGLALAAQGLPLGEGVVAWGSETFAAQAAAGHPGARLLHIGSQGFGGDWPRGDAAAYPNLILADGEAEAGLDWAALLAACPGAMAAANRLLVGKQVEKGPEQLHVRLAGGGAHSLQQLSMGEKRICQLCALAEGALKPGGLLMLDEPDVHLHPSQILGFMATLENLIQAKSGQLWLISHQEVLWRRYEELGTVVALSGEGRG